MIESIIPDPETRKIVEQEIEAQNLSTSKNNKYKQRLGSFEVQGNINFTKSPVRDSKFLGIENHIELYQLPTTKVKYLSGKTKTALVLVGRDE